MRIITPLICLLLSSCASHLSQPLEYQAELKNIQQRASHAQEQVARASTALDREWFPLATTIKLSDGLSLAEANSLALFYAPKILAARAEQRIAGSQLIAAGLLPNPDLFLGPRFSTNDAHVIFPASFSFPLSIFGQRTATKALAKASLEQANFQLMVAELGVLQDVAASYSQVLEKSEQLRIRKEEFALFEALTRWVNTLFGSGGADSTLLFLARSESDKAFAALELSAGELAAAESNLFSLLGILPGSSTLDLEMEYLQRATPPALEANSFINHPRMLEAKAAYESADAALRLEVAKQFPEFRFGFEGESEGSEHSLGVGLSAELPIFSQNQPGISAAQSRLLLAKQQYQALILELAHERALAERNAEIAQRILSNLQQGRLALLDEARRALEARFASGQGDVLATLSALNALTDARIEEIALKSRLSQLRLTQAVLAGAAFSHITSTEIEHE